MKEKKFVFFMKENGKVIDVPIQHITNTTNLHPNWKMYENIEDTKQVEAIMLSGLLLCDTCGFSARSEQGSKLHKNRSHGNV